MGITWRFRRNGGSLEKGARCELEGETGVRWVYLAQRYTLDLSDRDPRERIITVAYYALIPSDKLPILAFDHAEIVENAHRRLIAKLHDSIIAFQFMPVEFILS